VADLKAVYDDREELIIACRLSFPGDPTTSDDAIYIINPEISAYATCTDALGNKLSLNNSEPRTIVIATEEVGGVLRYTGDVIRVDPPWVDWIDVTLTPGYDLEVLTAAGPITCKCTAYSVIQDPDCIRGLGDPNDCIEGGLSRYYETSGLTAPFDLVDWVGYSEVSIDIKPDSWPNTMPLSQPEGNVGVAILTTPEFDATQVVQESLVFAGALVARKSGKPRAKLVDINDDGHMDIIAHFLISDIKKAGILNSTSTVARLEGVTTDGTAFFGHDAVKVQE
jgi:hypothetical protein